MTSEKVQEPSGNIENMPATQAIFENLLEDTTTPAWWDIDSRRYGVKIGDLRILLPAGVESEVLENSKLTLLPRAPAGLLGVVNVRGNLVPVFDLSLIHGWPTSDASYGSTIPVIVMIGMGKTAFALRVNELPEPHRGLHRDESIKALAVFGQHFIAGWKTEDDTHWLELSLEAFLSERASNFSETNDISFHSTSFHTKISPQEEFQ